MAKLSIFAALLVSMFLSGSQSENIEQYQSILIDFEKYRHAIDSQSQSTGGVPLNYTISKECADLENEEYRMCGKKCVLGCRYDSIAVEFITSKDECDTNKCVEGCFCKQGFLRYHEKCVPVNECSARRNKAMGLAAESNVPDKMQMKVQNSTQIASQMPTMNSNKVEMERNNSNPKTFGFLNRPGCGIFACPGVPLAVQLQQYDESIRRKEANHSEFGGNQVHNHDKNREPNRSPIHIHVHSASSSHTTATNKKDTDKIREHETVASDQVESNDPDYADDDAADVKGAIPFGFPNSFLTRDSSFGVPTGNVNFPDFGNLPNFGSFQNPIVKKDPVSGSNGLAYSVTYNPNGTRTLHVFGLGRFTYLTDGTIISSSLNSKILLPFEMGVENPSSVPNNIDNDNNPETVDNTDENEEIYIEDPQSDTSHDQPSDEQIDEQEVEEDEQQESDDMYDHHESNEPPKQNYDKDQILSSHSANSPPFYPYQYPSFNYPNMPPYSMPMPMPIQTGGPLSPGFNPFNYLTTPPPTNLLENYVPTQKLTKKKSSNKHHTKGHSKKPSEDSDKQITPLEEPNIEHSTENAEEPSKPNHQVYAASQTYPNGFLTRNPFNSFIPNPFNNQFPNGLPFYSNNFPPFFNYMNPSNGFKARNDFPPQFGQINPLTQNFYGNNPFMGKNFNAASYQDNPHFNLARFSNDPLAYQSINQKLDEYPQYFNNPSSTRN